VKFYSIEKEILNLEVAMCFTHITQKSSRAEYMRACVCLYEAWKNRYYWNNVRFARKRAFKYYSIRVFVKIKAGDLSFKLVREFSFHAQKFA
jgi:hypothetical protein